MLRRRATHWSLINVDAVFIKRVGRREEMFLDLLLQPFEIGRFCFGWKMRQQRRCQRSIGGGSRLVKGRHNARFVRLEKKVV